MNKLEWQVSEPQHMTELNNYLDGGELLSAVCPPQGYSIWATADIEECRGTMVIYGQGDTEEDAKENLWENIKKFLELLDG